MSGGGSSLIRLRGILRKETLQILRDPSSIALAVVMPLVLLFIFGYGVTLDADHVPVAIVNHDNGTASRDLAARLELSPNFEVFLVKDRTEAETMLNRRQVDAIIQMQADLTDRLKSGTQATVQLIVNGIDANRARLIQGYVHNVVGLWARVRLEQGELAATPPVEVAPRVWFNEAVESRNFMVPGLITLIMTLIGILLTALVVAREWERGTMEAMLVTPVRRFDILIGKILPYYVLGMLGMGLSVGVAIFVFQVPFRGSVAALVLLSSLFMLASLGFGLLLSSAIRIQFVAAQVSIVAGFLPAFFLSGLIFDLESTPRFIQIVSHIVPARYFVNISHTLFMAGDVWPVLLPDGLVLAAMAVFFLSMAFKNITKRLEK
ncbi:MAG: ABC transporter permease [Desulforhopalus sp.]